MRLQGPLRAIRDHLVGESGRFVLEPRRSVSLPGVRQADVYVHIPFCRSLCPYCPYNRVLYDEAAAGSYLQAMLAEIDAYADALGPIEIGSIYIGGGTPTTMLDGLGPIIGRLRERFVQTGPIAVECLPSDLDDAALEELHGIGVSLLSIGVQSFDDGYLKLIGRNYRSDILDRVVSRALETGFDSVNLDLMFALPGQTLPEALADLDHAIDLGADQVTLYPLFTFPYSSIGRHLRLAGVRFPPLPARRRMYRSIHAEALALGLERVSVWGFSRDRTTPYSSVTRDRFIGLGAGSATHLPGVLYFNTFSVEAYTENCLEGRLPVALVMAMTPEMERWYWLYWRLYETVVPKDGLRERFGEADDVARLFRLAAALGLLVDTGETFELTERGAFWIHLLQNHYVLNDINTVWTTAMRTAWPGRIVL